MQFEFATANRIIFGSGSLQKISSFVEPVGTRAFVVTGRSFERVSPLVRILEDLKIQFEIFHINGEPTTTVALEGANRAQKMGARLVFGFGGGSVLDTGKVIAALLTNHGDLFDYLEVIGKGISISEPPVPYIAIPTTAGTGAEVTRNAVLLSPEHRVKVSMRSPMMLPSLAVIDPELTFSMPQAVTASTGLDAFTQLIEAFVSRKANPLTDGICREGIQRTARSLKIAFDDGKNVSARQDMALASLFGGLALANAGLGAVHGFAGPLGGMFDAPHGALCARLLPFVIEANVRILEKREPTSVLLKRFGELAQFLTGKTEAQAGVRWIKNLCAALNIPPLAEFGLKTGDIPEVVEKSKNSSSTKGNPIDLSTEELTEILEKAI